MATATPPARGEALLRRTSDALAKLHTASSDAGFLSMDRWEATLGLAPVGIRFDSSDLTTLSDVQIVALYNQYDAYLREGERQFREVEQELEALDYANDRHEFDTVRLQQMYKDLRHSAEANMRSRTDGMRHLARRRDEVHGEIARRRSGGFAPIASGIFDYHVVGEDFYAADDDGYEGIDDLESLKAAFAETDGLAPIGKLSFTSRPLLSRDMKRVLEDHRRHIRGVRFDLERKKKLRTKVQRFLNRQNLSPEKRAEGETLLRDVKTAIAEKEREITLLRQRINEIQRSAPPRPPRKNKKKVVDQLPDVPTHSIKGRVGFDDDDDSDEGEEELEAIGFSLSTWAKDKKQDYKSRLEKYTKPGSATGDDGMTVRQKEERRRKEAKRRVSEAKRTAKKGERERKAGKRQAERAARQQRQQGVRAARQEERALKQTVKKRTSAQTRAAKKEFDAARRRYQAQTKRAKQAASKELKQARQQRVKKAHREKKLEHQGLTRARKTFKPQKGAKKDVRRAEKDKKAVFGERDKRIKFQRRAEAWKKRLHGDVDRAPKDSGPAPPDALVSDAPFPSGRDVADALFAAAQVSTFGPDPYDHDGIDDDDGNMGDEEEYAADAILGHLPPECAEDEDVVRMVEGYVGAWVSAAIGSEVCEVASGLGLSTDDVRDILDLHAADIAERIGGGELGERWLDFHHVNARLIDEDDGDYDPDGDHAFAAEQLFIGINNRDNAPGPHPDRYSGATQYGERYGGMLRYVAPYTAPRNPRRYYLPDHDRRVYYADDYEVRAPRPTRYSYSDYDPYEEDVETRMRGRDRIDPSRM